MIVKNICKKSGDYRDQILRLNRFLAELARAGIPAETVGFFNAETFFEDGVTFYYGEFYDERAAEVFENVVGAEMGFLKEEIVLAEAAIDAQENGKKWQIGVKFVELTDMEEKVALRLAPILHDLVASLARARGGFLRENYPLVRRDRDLAFALEVVLPRGENFEDFCRVVADEIASYPLRDNFDAVKNVFEAASLAPQMKFAEIEYFRNTGILTSNREIAELATFEVVESVLKKVGLFW